MKYAILLGCAIASFVVFSAKASDIKFEGDIRFRYHIEDDSQAVDLKHMLRIQAKLGVKVKINNQVDAGLCLASGNNATSANYTLGNGWGRVDLGIDQAYLKYTPSQLNGLLNVTAGKIKYPWWTPGNTELVWDGDVRPEGLNVTLNHKANAFTLFSNLGGFVIDSNNPTAADELLGAIQLGASCRVGVLDIKGAAAFYGYGGTSVKYRILNAGVEITTEVSDELTAGVLVDLATNTEGGDYGVLAGVIVKGSKWKGHANYRLSEEYSVYDDYNDSTFAGGSSDSRGVEVGFGYEILEYTFINLSVFVCEKDQSKDTKRNVSIVQLDARVKF